MRIPSLRNTLLAATLLAAALLNHTALAQDAPPGRVARVDYTEGTLNFVDANGETWSELLPNRPLAGGDSIAVPRSGRAELHLGSSALRLGANTRLGFTTLDDERARLSLWQGQMIVRVRSLGEREAFEVSTPNLLFVIQQPGEYRFDIGTDHSTAIMVRSGAGFAQGERGVLNLHGGESTRFYGKLLAHDQIDPVPAMDTFDLWAYERDRAEDNSVSARYVPREVIGYQQLDEHGIWEHHSGYGAVWYPRSVVAGWAPYRDGRWVWVAPWGWTWVDRAPWGFAPYHYGRWVVIGRRWAWVPGRYQHYRPVYAPALVVFVGSGSGGGVGWFPLGPGEAYRPAYSHNPAYFFNINQGIVKHNTVTNVYINQTVHKAITVVPGQTFTRGEHVLPASRTPTPTEVKPVIDAGLLPKPVDNRATRETRQGFWPDRVQPETHPPTGVPMRVEQLGAPAAGAALPRPQAVTPPTTTPVRVPQYPAQPGANPVIFGREEALPRQPEPPRVTAPAEPRREIAVTPFNRPIGPEQDLPRERASDRPVAPERAFRQEAPVEPRREIAVTPFNRPIGPEQGFPRERASDRPVAPERAMRQEPRVEPRAEPRAESRTQPAEPRRETPAANPKQEKDKERDNRKVQER